MKLRLALVVLSCLVSIVTRLVLSRSGSAVATAGKRARPLIGLSLDTLKEERWRRDRENFVKNAGALGADVKVQSANGDDVRQVSDVQTLITEGVDVIVIAPHNGDAMAKAVKLAQLCPVIAAASYDNGQIQVPTVLLEIIAVTKDNLRDTVIEDGFHSTDEVFPRSAIP